MERGGSWDGARVLRPNRSGAEWRLQRAAYCRLLAADSRRSGHGRGVSRQQNSRESTQPGRPAVLEALSAAERDAGRRKLQQLGDVGRVADPLQPAKLPRRLDDLAGEPADGEVHPRYVEEQCAERPIEPLGRRSVPIGRFELGPAKPVVRRIAQSERGNERYQQPSVLVLGK